MERTYKQLINQLDEDKQNHKQKLQNRDFYYRKEMEERDKRFRQESAKRERRIMATLNNMEKTVNNMDDNFERHLSNGKECNQNANQGLDSAIQKLDDTDKKAANLKCWFIGSNIVLGVGIIGIVYINWHVINSMLSMFHN